MFPSHSRNNNTRSHRQQAPVVQQGAYPTEDMPYQSDPYYSSSYHAGHTGVAQSPAATSQAPHPRWEPPANLQAMYMRETGAYVGNASPQPQHYQHPPSQQQTQQRHPQQPPTMPPQPSYPTPEGAQPGQANYKWTPPLLMQAFQTNADGSPVPLSPPPQHAAPQATHHTPAVVRREAAPRSSQVSAATQKYTAFVEWAKSQVVESVENAIVNEGFNDVANEQDIHGQTLLHAVCGTGNLSVLFFLCDTIEGMFEDAIYDNEGRLPIHCACEKGYLPIVRFIVNTLGLDPSTPSSTGRTPLHYAAEGNHVELVRYLLSVDADVSARDAQGFTPFLAAVTAGSSAAALILAEHSSSSDISATDSHGNNAITLAILGGHLLILKQILSLPQGTRPNLDAKCYHGKTALHHAAAAGDFTAVHQLLLAGANPNIGDKSDRKPADYDSTGIARFIIDGPEKVSVASKTSSDSVPVNSPWSKVGLRHVARDMSEPNSNGSHSDVISPTSRPVDVPHPKSRPYIPPPPNTSFLPPKDPAAPAAWKLKRSKPATSDSAEKVQESAAAALQRMRARSSSTQQSAPAVVTEKRWSVHGQSHPGAVHADTGTVYSPPVASPKASEQKNVESTSPKVAVNPVVESPEVATSAPSETFDELFEFARDGNVDALESVLGAAPHIHKNPRQILDNNGLTLLHEACANGHLATAQYLVEGVGSDVDAVDASGQPALYHAIRGEHVLVVRYLVKYCGARLDIVDNNDEDASELSRRLTGTNAEEIKKTISKAVSKSPEKRTKVVVPVFAA